ncbi:hypothetical protein LGQ02_07430 [Bacillus shivajii]|uniref:competence type IV pilus minor pilin ComGG n=1 Tax=Bacillus shivajii TaxID=1983719 RepID=UPI001CFA233A|nr:competence type IV pilus minor pilin ComGG [Bacillus shivajii]UCZ54576.1 hypothetical protein LGQ02_07430 [Bacillus shivajii]
MMNNEKGFILLLSLSLLSLSSALLIHLLIIYETEKSFIYLEKERNKVDNLLLTTLTHVVNNVDEVMNGDDGTIQFRRGQASYTVELKEEVAKITINAQSQNGTTRVLDVDYHMTLGEILNWSERPR